MDIKYNKTLGPKSSKLILDLYSMGLSTFTFKRVSEISGLPDQNLRNILSRLTKKGILNRIQAGLYSIVSFDLGHVHSHLGDPLVVAREIAQKSSNGRYFISHASAMDIHQMLTQPQFITYTSVDKQIKKSPEILGSKFKFITIKPEHYFGFEKHWIGKSEMVLVSDLERTILDCLRLPENCGGVTEIAKGIWMKRGQINYDKIVKYSQKINVGSVYKRLGFLLELYGFENLEQLREKISGSYSLLDPTLENEGIYNSTWKLRLNVEENELKSIIRT